MRKAFTLIELIFVIVVVAIVSKFGIEMLMGTYENFIFTSTQNRLQSQSESAVTQIASRLQYRIKDSAIARWGPGANFRGLNAADGTETVLEWIGYDAESFRSTDSATPIWSGFIDVNDPATTVNNLSTPGSNLNLLQSYIKSLRPAGSNTNKNRIALFFLGESAVNVLTDFGFDGNALADQSTALHRVRVVNDTTLRAQVGDWTNVEIGEFYQLAWTAYALEVENYTNFAGNTENRLVLWYDYQPWEGESYNQGTKMTIMEHIDTFGFRSIGDMIKIQVCTTDADIFNEGSYAVCKEKTVF